MKRIMHFGRRFSWLTGASLLLVLAGCSPIERPVDPAYVPVFHFGDTRMAIPNWYLTFPVPRGTQPFDRRVCTAARPLAKAEIADCGSAPDTELHVLFGLPDLGPPAPGKRPVIAIVIGYEHPEYRADTPATEADSHSDRVLRTRWPDLDTPLYTAYRVTWSAGYLRSVNAGLSLRDMEAVVAERQRSATQYIFVSKSGAPPARAICEGLTADTEIICWARFKHASDQSPYSLDFSASVVGLDLLPALAPGVEAKVAGFVAAATDR
jgi:hypothetical protein